MVEEYIGNNFQTTRLGLLLNLHSNTPIKYCMVHEEIFYCIIMYKLVCIEYNFVDMMDAVNMIY